MSKPDTRLPASWIEVELRELTDVNYGKALSAGARVADGRVPVIGSSGVVGRHDTALVTGPCLVIGRKGAAGSVHLVRESSWPIDTAYFIQPPREVDLVYLSHVMGTCELGSLDKSTAIPSLGRDDLYRVQIPIAPSNEQTRIVEKLEELLSDLDAGVAELKAAQKKLGQYRQSLLKAAVEGALTAEWRAARSVGTATTTASFPRKRESSTLPGDIASDMDSRLRGNDGNGETGGQLLQRILTERRVRWEAKQLAKFKEQGKTPPKDWQKKYPEPVQPDTSGLPELPQGWVWASADQLTEFITSGSRGWGDYYADSGATFIRSQNINKDWLDLSDIAYVNPPRGSEGVRTRVQRDDVLLTITGANVGKTAHVETEMDEAYVSQHVALIRPVDVILSEVLHLFLTAEAGGRGQLNKEAYGAGKPGLNLQQVAGVCVPLASASEIEVLLKNVKAQLDAATAMGQAIGLALKQSTAQRQNILRAAFAGQLVPQDPADEPASVLLERVRAERAARESAKKSRNGKARESA